jgi:hypothetical protein
VAPDGRDGDGVTFRRGWSAYFGIPGARSSDAMGSLRAEGGTGLNA